MKKNNDLLFFIEKIIFILKNQENLSHSKITEEVVLILGATESGLESYLTRDMRSKSPYIFFEDTLVYWKAEDIISQKIDLQILFFARWNLCSNIKLTKEEYEKIKEEFIFFIREKKNIFSLFEIRQGDSMKWINPILDKNKGSAEQHVGTLMNISQRKLRKALLSADDGYCEVR